MKNNKGVTLVSLVTTIILIIILTAITAVTSMDAYNQMKLETFKSELEEVQKKVNEISADYQLYKNDSSVIAKYASSAPTYSTYFEDKFGSKPALYVDSDSKFSNLKDACSSLVANEYTFYFSSTANSSQSDIEKYLGLKGLSTDIVIDFSTRIVYSVTGCKDPENTSQIYYTASQYEESTVVDSTNAVSNLNGFSTVSTTSDTVGSTTIYTIVLQLTRETTGSKYSIKNVYYKKGTDWIKVEDFTELKNEDKVKFVVYDNVTQFKLVDRSGKTVEN